MRRILKVFVFILGLFFIIPGVNAASLDVSVNATTVNPGATIRIRANANGLTGKFSITNSNSDVLSGATGSEWLENNSSNYTFTAKNIGTATITITPTDVADSNGNKYSKSETITINVVKPRDKSTNNNLKSLGVEGYEMTPSFSKDTLEYTVNIDKNVERVKINASLEDGYARLSGNGEREVEEGSNKIEVVVTSETGSTKTYVLNINVKDANPITKTFNGKEYSVIKRSKSLTLPDVLDSEKFTLSTIKIGDTEVPVYTSDELTLAGLKDEKGNIYFFTVVDNEIKERYDLFSSDKINILFTEPKDENNTYTKTNITINGKEYSAYKNEDTILIYGTNIDTNVSNWYRYDEKENTIQIYDSSALDKLNLKEKEFNDTLDEYKSIILGLAGLSGLLLVVIVVLLISKLKLKKKINKVNNIKNEDGKVEKKVENEEPKKEEKKVVKEEPEKEEKNEKQEEIATKVEENKKLKDEKEKAKEEIVKIEEKLSNEEKEEKQVEEEIIPTFEEIEEDLKEVKKDNIKEETKVVEEDELMDPYDFLDIKRKRRKK